MSLAEITQTHGWKNFMAKLYGIGASVVIIGALFKIMHWPGAGIMLIAGLGTEAIIFFFSAFEPLHEELDWTLVYPELAGLGEGDEIKVPEPKKQQAQVPGGHALAKFDEMLEKTGGANLFEKLGAGLNNLTERVKDLSDISNAALVTNEYSKTMKNASESVDEFNKAYKKSTNELSDATDKLTNSYKQSSESLNYSIDTLSDSYSKASQQFTDSHNKSVQKLSDTYNKVSDEIVVNNTNFTNAYQKLTSSMNIDFSAFKDGNKTYADQLSSLNKNLAALNAIFEMQLNEADLDKMMEDLAGSVQHSKNYNTQVAKLGKRLEALNEVYGKMLTAMNVKVE